MAERQRAIDVVRELRETRRQSIEEQTVRYCRDRYGFADSKKELLKMDKELRADRSLAWGQSGDLFAQELKRRLSEMTRKRALRKSRKERRALYLRGDGVPVNLPANYGIDLYDLRRGGPKLWEERHA